ncbi:MAG: hypothetical protein GX455_10610 [Phycisphaerae bacterium]|nr:hypothetical protein [Phycisphaerae bacterium]
MEKLIYTRSWARDFAKGFSLNLFRSVLFALVLLIGFLGALFLVDFSDETAIDQPALSDGDFVGLVFLAFLFLILCCYVALFFVANDRFWGIGEPAQPMVWDEQETRWITSTVSFAHYLEERGSQINASLIRYDDPRAAAHRMIDKVDDRTLQLYLSLLSAVQLERDRVRVDSAEVKPKTLESKTHQS